MAAVRAASALFEAISALVCARSALFFAISAFVFARRAFSVAACGLLAPLFTVACAARVGNRGSGYDVLVANAAGTANARITPAARMDVQSFTVSLLCRRPLMRSLSEGDVRAA